MLLGHIVGWACCASWPQLPAAAHYWQFLCVSWQQRFCPGSSGCTAFVPEQFPEWTPQCNQVVLGSAWYFRRGRLLTQPPGRAAAHGLCCPSPAWAHSGNHGHEPYPCKRPHSNVQNLACMTRQTVSPHCLNKPCVDRYTHTLFGTTSKARQCMSKASTETFNTSS